MINILTILLIGWVVCGLVSGKWFITTTQLDWAGIWDRIIIYTFAILAGPLGLWIVYRFRLDLMFKATNKDQEP